MPKPQPRWRPHTHKNGKPKVRYATLEEASEAVERIILSDLEKGRIKDSSPSAYECSDPECGAWHVGNWSDKAWQQQCATVTTVQ